VSQENIRNFAIIAHVDAGKSTLSDRLMELTGAVPERQLRQQMLDTNPIERERGVTIKLAPVTMSYRLRATSYVLNLIDTPGHVDFSYEVERSLAACEGAILLVDAAQGIQAQTLAHAQKAADLGLTVIPAVNKIDLLTAQPQTVTKELKDIFGYRPEEISLVSAKTGQGVPQLLDRIVKEIPSPAGLENVPLRALIFNSAYDRHLGVIAFIRVVDGALTAADQLQLLSNKVDCFPKEIGIFTPTRMPQQSLTAGQVGYIATGLKDISQVCVGDTLTQLTTYNSQLTTPLPGYRQPQPMVFADVYPAETVGYEHFVAGVAKLRLQDASLTAKPVHSQVLGPGLRLGFLGLFHIEITKERLVREQNIDTVFTLPTVQYSVELTNGKSLAVQNPNEFPDSSTIKQIKEPVTDVSIFTPAGFIGPLMQVLTDHRGIYLDTSYLGDRARLSYHLPLSELISGLFDAVKSVSRGFGSIDYHIIAPQPIDAVKLTILVNHEAVQSLSRIVVREKARQTGTKMVETLKDLLPPQQFAVPIQAAVGGEILARADKKAVRKDVTAKLYGGDQTRKDKLLKKQKKGKKRLAKFGRVVLPDAVLFRLLTVS
jgi:GTP-binding protein LepA